MNKLARLGAVALAFFLVLPLYPNANLSGKWEIWMLLVSISGAAFVMGDAEE